MGQVKDALGTLIERFARIADQTQSLRFALGDTVNEMLAIPDVTMSLIVRRLKARLPNAKEMLGYAITDATLKRVANMASTFTAEGGLIHGKHRVTRDDIEALNLTPAEASRLAELANGGHIRIKSIESTAKKVRKAGGTGHPHAQAAVDHLKQAIAKGDEAKVTVQSIAQISERLEKIAETRKRLDKEEAELRTLLAARKAEGESRTKVDAPKPAAEAPKAMQPKGKPRKRPAAHQPSA